MLRFLSLLSIIIIIDFRLYAQHGYSKDVIKDFSKLSNGRKSYITKRADKKNLNVSDYLKSKYGVVNEG